MTEAEFAGTGVDDNLLIRVPLSLGNDDHRQKSILCRRAVYRLGSISLYPA
jgi:hypothetical protein